jgi:hypothetical protein
MMQILTYVGMFQRKCFHVSPLLLLYHYSVTSGVPWGAEAGTDAYRDIYGTAAQYGTCDLVQL